MSVRIFLPLICLSLLFSFCKRDDDDIIPTPQYLIFGHFYGECIGEQCIEIFKLENGKLYEDEAEQYPNPVSGYEAMFIELPQAQYDLVSDLLDAFPDALLEETENVFGCPDCLDQGGIYLEYLLDNELYYWTLDQDKTDVPDYLHDFMDMVNEKINLINN